jgi:hypothetical protein
MDAEALMALVDFWLDQDRRTLTAKVGNGAK